MKETSFLLSSISTLALSFILGLTAFGQAAGKPEAPPAPLPLSNSAIAYVDAESIKVADADGSNQVTLVSRRRTKFWFPSWSPDGNTIIFSSDLNGPGIYRIRINRQKGTVLGPELVVSTNDVIIVKPVWSPVPTLDGNYKIAYGDHNWLEDRVVLYLVDVDEHGALGQPFKLSTHPFPGHENFSEYLPSWSPDASKLAIATHDGSSAGIEIVTLTNDCNDGSPLCEEPGTRRDPIGELGSSPFNQYGASHPAWANMPSSGNKIALSGTPALSENGDIWIIEFDDNSMTTIWNLTNTNTANPYPDRQESGPTWSPDDSQIMYQGWDYLCQPQTNKERGHNVIIRNVGDGEPGPDFGAPACEEKMIVQRARMPSWWRGR